MAVFALRRGAESAGKVFAKDLGGRRWKDRWPRAAGQRLYGWRATLVERW